VTVTVEWRALGTSVRLVTTREEGLEPARCAVEAQLDVLDLACSRFRADSELCALNRSAGRWVPVSPLLLGLLEAALWAAGITGGAVDPTVGTALRVAGYDRDYAAIPADAGPIVVRLRPVPGWQAVELDTARSRVRMAPGTELDLGSTGKAVAADRAAAAALAAVGSGGVLVSLGGDIAVAGTPPGDGWPVLVAEDASVPPDAGGPVVVIRSGGIATSSTQVRRWTRDGVELHHLIDPATGAPVDGPWRTATVAAATCLQANTAATGAIVRGNEAVGWLDALGLLARLVGTDGRLVTLGGWPPHAA
jgi:thiamine biosynthesis lipoprotein